MTIFLSLTHKVLVPDQCFKEILGYRWKLSYSANSAYATRVTNAGDPGSRKNRMMHREIWEMLNGPIPHGKMIDHKDGNGLNNSIENLRLCNSSQNNSNKRVDKTNDSSQYKGVCWDIHQKKWIVSVGPKGTARFVGRFATEEQAARAYDKKARELFGEFACLNFPEESE